MGTEKLGTEKLGTEKLGTEKLGVALVVILVFKNCIYILRLWAVGIVIKKIPIILIF